MSDHAPHSAEEAARLLLGLRPDDEETATLDRVRELRTKAAAFDALTSVLAEVHARLLRDEHAFREARHVSVSDARIRADACAVHSRALARLLESVREHVAAGRTHLAIDLLRGDIPPELRELPAGT